MGFLSVLMRRDREQLATRGLVAKGNMAPNLQSGHMCTHEVRMDSRHVQSYVSSLVVKNSLLESFLQRGVCNLVLRQPHLFHLLV